MILHLRRVLVDRSHPGELSHGLSPLTASELELPAQQHALVAFRCSGEDLLRYRGTIVKLPFIESHLGQRKPGRKIIRGLPRYLLEHLLSFAWASMLQFKLCISKLPGRAERRQFGGGL